MMGNSPPGARAPGFVLARFQRSGRQPSQDLREDDRFGCIRYELSYSGFLEGPEGRNSVGFQLNGTSLKFPQDSDGFPLNDCGNNA